MFGHQDEPKNLVNTDDDQAASTDTVEPTAHVSDSDNSSNAFSTPVVDLPSPATHGIPASSDALLDIKQQALQQLTPLVGHLEQSPEEKFRTTMMMIQASDNQGLIKDAYEAAQAITDEKVRAQALLDIVNEINYFTQHAAANK